VPVERARAGEILAAGRALAAVAGELGRSRTAWADDISHGAVDISASVARELEEETGLAPDQYRSEPDWHCVFTGPAMAMIRILHVDMTGDALRARIEANLALQQLPELSAIHLVRGTRDLTSAMPGFVTAFIEAQLARQG